MIKDLTNTFKQTAIYGLVNILTKAAGLVLLPIYTNTLSISDFGVLAIFEIMAQFFVGVLSFQLPSSLLRLGSETVVQSERNQIFFISTVLTLISASLFLVIALPLSKIFSESLFNSSENYYYFYLLFFSIIPRQIRTIS